MEARRVEERKKEERKKESGVGAPRNQQSILKKKKKYSEPISKKLDTSIPSSPSVSDDDRDP